MKILLVYPRFEKFLSETSELDRGLIEYFLGDFTTPPSLGLALIVALTPPDIEIELLDDNAGDTVDFTVDADLVAINCFTPQATRAFEIGDGFREHGKPVIMGGIFPSFMVDECLKHADSVNVGEVEPTWSRILEDVARGELARKYVGGHRFDLSKMPVPERSIFYERDDYDWDEDLVQVTRGCSYTCGMCSIPALMGHRIRFRPIEDVVSEIAGLRHENVYLADDTLFFPHRRVHEYAEALFQAVAPLEKKFFVSSTLALNTDTSFLDLAARAGVKNFYCTMNVDPVSIRALRGEKNERRLLADLVKKLEDRDIRFFGSCALGRDWDDGEIAHRILDLYTEAGIRTAEFFIFTPYPGSVHWDRMLRQDRIIDTNWSHYNGAHVVSRPYAMSPERLHEQFVTVWREFFSLQGERHGASLEPATWEKGVQVVGKPMQRRGVRLQAAITGIGVLSPLGNDCETITAALREGRSALRPITRFDTSHFTCKDGGEIDVDPGALLREGEADTYRDRYLRYGIAAARRAVEDSGLAWDAAERRTDVALVLGTCNGGLLSAEEEYAWKHGKSDRAFDEDMNREAQLYGFGKAIAAALGVGGETWVVTTACSSSTAALGLAQMIVNRGHYRTVIVGGTDALSLANMSGFEGLKATSSTRMAPFSLPVGLNTGEAACFWVVEEMETAILRHARCYGKLVGHTTTSDAYHPTTPDPRGDGVYRTLRGVLADSGLPLAEIGCINAHGTGTEANDKVETKGIARFLGEASVPVVSTKSFFGHCMGVTGILEATCNLLAMNEGFIPPTLSFSDPRPGCTLDHAPNQPRVEEYDAFISTNYAFGGNNAGVVIASWDSPVPPREPPRERVVITGVGSVTGVGLGVPSTLQAVRSGIVAMTPVDRLQLTGMRSRLAGLVPDFKEADVDRRLDFTGMNPISRLATAAARLALGDAGLRVNRRNAEDVGIVMGVCNGPSEMGHMDSVFSSETHAANIGSFATITANSTAGWVSNALCLKGVNMSLAPGPHAGLQALAYAYDALAEGRARAILAGAADEVYSQTYANYDMIDFLYRGADEESYRIHLEEARRKVLGEGAGVLVLETLRAARERGAEPALEILGYGMSMDAGPFLDQNMDSEGLRRALSLALSRSGVSSSDIGLVVWAPQGNSQDRKVLEAIESTLGEAAAEVPLVTTTFNTGYIESASLLVSLATAVEALRHGTTLWPQRTGLPEIDSRRLEESPSHVLALGSTDLGYNFSAIFGRLVDQV